MLTLKRTLLSFALVAAAAVGTVGAASASASTPYCGITWGSLPKEHMALSPAPLVNVRTGQHDCYDRVVFDFNGPATGYTVSYVDQVLSEGKGEPLNVAGGARLGVHLQAPAYDVETGRSTYSHSTGDHVANLSGYRTLRDVVYGGSFEGYTTFGVGTRARLPFRVFTLPGPAGQSRIVIDVAHQWSS
jgi:hypothetical protein